MTYLLAFTIYFAPAYALRFGAFGLPLNALLVWVVHLIFLGGQSGSGECAVTSIVFAPV
jgi:hypothetical protein